MKPKKEDEPQLLGTLEVVIERRGNDLRVGSVRMHHPDCEHMRQARVRSAVSEAYRDNYDRIFKRTVN